MYIYAQSLMISVLAAGLALLLIPGERRRMLTSGLFLIPALLVFAPVSEGTYWSPQRLIGGPIGIEDVGFCICIGILTWGLTALRFGPLPDLTWQTTRFLRRAGLTGAASLAVFAGALSLGVSYGMAAFLCQIFAAGAALWFARSLARHALFGALAITAYYLLAMSLAAWIWGSDFTRMWAPEHIWGLFILGVPVEEYLWSASFGAAWVPLLLFASGRDGRKA